MNSNNTLKHMAAEDMAEAYARTVHENYRRKRLEDARKQGLSQEAVSRILLEDNMAEWDSLKEIYKRDNRAQIRFLSERFERQDVGIGIRPIAEDAADAVRELDGPVMEILAEAEHERWMRNKLEDGWSLGKRDNELKHHPDLLPYSELTESVKDYDRDAIRNIPAYLAEIGYELYHKGSG